MDHLLLATLVSFWIGHSALAAESPGVAMNRLASAKGCYTCHRADPGEPAPNAILPVAPSWKDIALKYKGQKGAEHRLTQIVLEGSFDNDKNRHWQGKVRFVGMLPNAPSIDKNEARRLVHWILTVTGPPDERRHGPESPQP
jgi:cytochrome c